MNKQLICLIIVLFLGINILPAQCDFGGPAPVICPSFSFSPFGSPTNCEGTTDCNGLNNGYLVISVPDTLILDVIEGDLFYANNYSGCVAVLPLCYNLSQVQNFVDIVVNQNSCCSVLNGQVPGLCDSIRSNFNSGTEVQNLNDLVNLFKNFSEGDLKPDAIIEALNSLNNSIGLLGLFCEGIVAIDYCYEPVDFYNSELIIYEINPAVCPFADCIDSIQIQPIFLSTYPHQSTFRAQEFISAEGIMLTDHALRSGNEVFLKPNFSVSDGAVLEVIMEDCVTSINQSDPDK